VNQKKEFCGAVDVGGTKISTALFTRDGSILARESSYIDREGGEAAARQVAESLERLQSVAGFEGGRLLAAAVCIPGIVSPANGTVWAVNVRDWINFPLVRLVRDMTALPFKVIDDRAAYITGEAWQGAARGARDAVFLAVGTGIGAGIMSGGRVISGSQGVSGAVGWFALSPHFRKEYAGMGCFEAEGSGDSVGRKARALVESGRKSLMLSLANGRTDRITAEIVAEAARSGDAAALEIVDDTVVFLAMGLANLVSCLNPEVVVLGGGLFSAADVFFEPVRREFKRWAQPVAGGSVKIELSSLGRDAGLYGCGRIAWESLKGE